MKRRCESCSAAVACKHTFGEFWKDKSSNGYGCNHPMDDEHAARVEDVIFKHRDETTRQLEIKLS